MSNSKTNYVSDKEIKIKIKEQIRKEELEKIEANRWHNLRKQVEVEEMWDNQCRTDDQREMVERWLKEWASGNYETYLDRMDEGSMPPIFVQMENKPDLYEVYHTSRFDPICSYRTKKQGKKDKESSIIAWAIVLCIPVVIGAIIYLIT